MFGRQADELGAAVITNGERRPVPGQNGLAKGEIYGHHRGMRLKTSLLGDGAENYD